MSERPAQAYCKRCGELFVYFRTKSERMYCSPCVRLNKKDDAAFRSFFRRAKNMRKNYENYQARYLSRLSDGCILR